MTSAMGDLVPERTALSRRAVRILAASALLQLAVISRPDTMGDLLDYRTWTRGVVRDGLAAAYWPPPPPFGTGAIHPPVDYPPLFPYLLWLVGEGLCLFSPRAFDSDDRLLDFMIRLPLCASLLLLALLVHHEARRRMPGQADLALALVALNPALLFDTAYWGQADALCALLIAAAFVALTRGRPEWSWIAITVGALVKPMAYPFVPLVLVYTLKRFGPARALRAAAASVLTAGLVLLPFACIGRLSDILKALFVQIDAMPYVSVNAHNVWWLVSGGPPWTEASVRPLGLVSWKAISLVVFGGYCVAVLVWLWRSSDSRAVYPAAASIAFGFFMLSTHMHENHLFYAVPLLALSGLGSQRVRCFILVVSLTFLANMLLHDPYLSHRVRPHLPGPHLILPQQLGLTHEIEEYLAAQGYPWIVEEIRGHTSLLGLLATLANAQVNALAFVAWLVFVAAGRSFDRVFGPEPRPWLGRIYLAAGAAFVLVSGAWFTSRALRFPSEHLVVLRFREAEVRAANPDWVRIASFDLQGEKRWVLFVHPPSEVRYRLVLPPRARLRFGMALAPETWSPAKGDGVGFEVRVEAGGPPQALFSRYIDPKRDPADRRWHDVALDLSAFSGREIALTFATTGGPAGSIDFDWAGFSDPILEGR